MFGAWLIVIDHGQAGSGLGVNVYVAIAATIATGALVGFINGFFVAKMRLNSFITTLAMLILLRGVTMGITNGQMLSSLPSEFLACGNESLFGIPVSILIAGFLYVIFSFFLRYHRLGRALYAIGGNPEAANVAGINVARVTWGCYIVGGILAAFAGLMLSGRIDSVVSSQGANMIYYVFASAVVGGISLNGGKGSLFGALTGVLLLGISSEHSCSVTNRGVLDRRLLWRYYSVRAHSVVGN